mgnify:CR=1 FL=1
MSKIVFLKLDINPIKLLQKGYLIAKLYDAKSPVDYVFVNKDWKNPIISYNNNAIFIKENEYYFKISSNHKLYFYLMEMLSINELSK